MREESKYISILRIIGMVGLSLFFFLTLLFILYILVLMLPFMINEAISVGWEWGVGFQIAVILFFGLVALYKLLRLLTGSLMALVTLIKEQ